MSRVLKFLGRDRETRWTFTLLLCLPYLAFLIWMHAHHEMWRDEVHAWTLSRLAHGFWDLVTGERIYDGHPPLWYWYLHIWSRFVEAAWGIQAATVAAALGAAVLLVRFAPFPRYLKVLLIFSYYFGYEYAVMARDYVLGWFLVCVFCVLYHPLRTRYVALGIALGMLSLTSIYGLVMCFFLLLFFVLDQITISYARESAQPPAYNLTISPFMLTTVIIAAALMAFCVLTLEPPDPNPFSPRTNFDLLKLTALPDMMYRLTAGYLPWRSLVAQDFWGGPFTLWLNKSAWLTYVGGGILLFTTLALYPSWRLMIAHLAAASTMLLFQQVRFEGGPRHWGHFFIFFFAACWLLRSRFPWRSHWPTTLALVALLAFQAESFGAATIVETREVFSGGRDAAAFIRSQGLQDLPLLGGPDYMMVTVAGYLRRPFIAAESEEVHQTVVFHSRRRGFSGYDLMNRAVAISRERKSPVIAVGINPLPAPPPGATSVLLFTSRPGCVADEVFWVYRIQAP
ncbi:MAG TPA: hypothetical protein VF550_17285 [Polyangia bacterium]